MAGLLELNFDLRSLEEIARTAGVAAVLDAELVLAWNDFDPMIQGAIQDNMHFDRGYATGELEGSVESVRNGPLDLEVGTNVPHAKFVDYGTGSHGASNPGNTHGDPTYHYGSKPGMTGEPYMGPAVVQVVPDMERRLIEAVMHAFAWWTGVP